MSHITDIKLRIHDLDALEEAAQARGLVLERGAKTHKWYGYFVGDSPIPNGMKKEDYGKCEHKLKLAKPQAGDFEIGVVKALDGGAGYDLVVDTWGQTRLLDAAGGPQMDGLRREYAAAVATKRAKEKLARRGYTVKRENLGNRIRLRLVHR